MKNVHFAFQSTSNKRYYWLRAKVLPFSLLPCRAIRRAVTIRYLELSLDVSVAQALKAALKYSKRLPASSMLGQGETGRASRAGI